jgi:hypothetical protein
LLYAVLSSLFPIPSYFSCQQFCRCSQKAAPTNIWKSSNVCDCQTTIISFLEAVRWICFLCNKTN